MIEFLTWFGLGIIPVFLLLDTFRGSRTYDAPKNWKVWGFIVTLFAVGLSFFIATIWGEYLAGVSLFDNSSMNIIPAVLLGLFTYELGHYWYHRMAHKYDILFRLGHQMHHSAEAIDSYTAFYLHPVDIFAFTTLGSLVYFPLLGLPLEAGLIASAYAAFSAMFQHANINTPRWIGYFIQRPESHGIHHQRGLHAYNYADLPLIDMMFGTFKNPPMGEAHEAGFYNGASKRVGEMLMCQDVTQPPEKTSSSSAYSERQAAE